MSLRYRIALTIFVLEAIMIGFVLWRVLSYTFESARVQLRATHHVTLDYLHDISFTALLTEDFGELQAYVERLSLDPQIETVLLLDQSDTIVVGSQIALVGASKPELRSAPERYWTTREVKGASGSLGLMAIEFSDVPLVKALRQGRNLGITTALSGMGIIAGAGLLMGFLLTRRLSALTEATDRLTAGDTDIQVAFSGRDEIARVGQAFDIMARTVTHTLQELRASEAQFRHLTEGSLQGVLIHRDFTPLYVNQACADLFGYETPEDILCMETIVPFIAPDEQERLTQLKDARWRGDDVPASYEFQGVRHDGTLLWLDARVTVINWQGQPAIQSTLVSITERKCAEEHMARHTQALERAVQEKTDEMEALMARVVRQEKLAAIGQVSGSLAHELRNPLSVIKQSLFFLTHLQRHHTLDQSNPKVSTHLQLMETEVDRANQSITQLLTMTQIPSSQPEVLDLRELLAEAVEHVCWGAQMQLLLTCAPDPYVLWADRWSMQHVFMNLLSNAAEACDRQGTVTVSAQVEAQTQQYQILVGDTGCGIPAAELEQVFEPLYTRKPWGIGLGLSLCKELIAHHGGRITLQSRVGHGTTVHILLPAASRLMTCTTMVEERHDGLAARDTDCG